MNLKFIILGITGVAIPLLLLQSPNAAQTSATQDDFMAAAGGSAE